MKRVPTYFKPYEVFLYQYDLILSAGLLYVAAHSDKALKTPETCHLSHSVRQINTTETQERKKERREERREKEGENNSDDRDRAKKIG